MTVYILLTCFSQYFACTEKCWIEWITLPLHIINPSYHVVHLLLVRFENALSSLYHILPCFHVTPLAFSALCSIAGRMEGKGSACWWRASSYSGFATQGLFCSLPSTSCPLPGLLRDYLSLASPELERMDVCNYILYTTDQNHTVKTWKYLNNFLFHRTCQPQDTTCSRATMYNVRQLTSTSLVKM